MRTTLTLTLALLVACGGKKTEPVEAPVTANDADQAALKALEESVVSSMNPEADACVDFYEYACGGWVASNELPADKSRLNRSFTTIYDGNQELLRKILDEASANPGDDPNLVKVGDFYGACMDTETINAKGLEPVKPWLDEIAAAKDNKALFVWSAKLQLAGGEPFFGAGVEPDYKKPDTNRLGLAQGGLGLPDRAYYLDERNAESKAAYEKHIAKMFQLAGDEERTATKKASQVVDFETKLAELAWPREELRDAEKTYHPMDLKGLISLTPQTPWREHFEAVGYGSINMYNVGTPDYFEGLDKLLGKTDPSVVKAYLSFHTLSHSAPYLSSAFEDENFAFYGRTLRGQQEMRPRWKRCVSRTESALGEVLGQIYVDRAFAGDSKQVAVEMIQSIESEFEKGMGDLDWMDDPTRAVAVEKSQAITNKIGYPDKWRDYSNLTVASDDHFGNAMRGSEHTSRFWLDQAGKPVDESLWYMTPQMVNAYYNPLANEIAFPAGILQPPFFDQDYPKAMNYGAIGMVMAHEVSHGFDDSGRKFSPTGELTEWWAPEVAERFEERAECIVEQYNGYEVQPDLFVNGKLTLGENIADLGGLKQSHRAYMAWLAQNGGSEPTVGDLTNEQLFFVAYAQGWCTIATPEYETEQVQRDPHSPARYRVNGPVRNLPAFGKAFGCEQGAPLYPEPDDVCVIW